MHKWRVETVSAWGSQVDRVRASDVNLGEIETLEQKQDTGEGKRILPFLFAFILIIGAGAIYYNNQNNTPTSTPPLFSYASPESQGISNQTVAKLTSIVQGYFDDEQIVGAELVLIKNRKIVLHEAVGWNDRENEIPMEINTLFNIRSMTKPVTGAAIQILIDEGRLSLDTKASEYIPGFDNNNSRDITIEQLLSHRSGLPLSIMLSVDDYETLQALANATGEIGPEFTPGTKFWYSDAGTEVLGAIIELETGMALDAFVTERLLEPLGMNNSFYYHLGTQNDSLRNRIADLYLGGIGEWVNFWSSEETFYPFVMGSQGLYSTPLDYAHFLALWMDEGRVGDTQLLSSEAVERTLTPVSQMSSLGSDMPYPEGFYNLEAYYGQMAILFSNNASGVPLVEVIGHSGSDGTYVWAWPDLDLMILYFTQSRGSTTGIKLESNIDELLIHPEIAALNEEIRVQYEGYLGSYIANFGSFRNAEFVVSVQNGGLALDIPNQLVFELEEPDEDGNWVFKLMDVVSVSFELDENGNATMMRLNQGGAVFELPKGTVSLEEVYPVDMEKYVGTFETEDPNITMGVVIYEGKLALEIPGQPVALELFPPNSEGLWFIRINPSVAVGFSEAEDGKIDSLSLYLPDGTVYVRKRIGDH